MREHRACCGGDGTFIDDEDQLGFVDLRHPPEIVDAGVAAAVD
jgi:hypothetical protein